ncbi:hypothetical protein COL922a_009291 [Colletotrichum nupharicola]|nr:hypothetical protein COL922a_009291 [Colletotrichum nupharicola]
MMLGPLGGPNSPPHSPTSAAPAMLQHKYAARHLPPSGIQPTGNGHQFSFTPSNRFAQLSPRTSSEDSDEESESESDSDESELPQAPQAKSEDEEDDSDDEESEDDSDDDADDEDEDVPMMAPPPPALMSAPIRAPKRAPSRPPMHQSMAVDSSSEEESDDEEDAEDEEGDDEESEEDSESSDSDSEMLPHAPEAPPIPRPAPAAVAAAASVAAPALHVKANFTVEEMSDFDPMDQDRDGIMAPSGYSSPASARSRSRAPVAAPKPDPTSRLAREFDHLNFPSSDSESEDLDADEAHEEFIRVQRTLRMLRRRTHGSSIGKRTISERSESDHEDMPLDPDAVGSSARRLRRRVGDQSVRRSFILQFQDPPPPRIDEIDEPDSEVEGIFFCDHETLARELPYYSIEIIEYESPSPTSPRSP